MTKKPINSDFGSECTYCFFICLFCQLLAKYRKAREFMALKKNIHCCCNFVIIWYDTMDLSANLTILKLRRYLVKYSTWVDQADKPYCTSESIFFAKKFHFIKEWWMDGTIYTQSTKPYTYSTLILLLLLHIW